MSHILIVDDERGIRESLFVLLSEEGHNIDTASDGMEAWQLLKKRPYDLVLTDIRMPNMTGLDLFEQIKEKFAEKIPVILLTSNGSVETAVKAVKDGASDFIIKPFEIEQLRNAVNVALKRERETLKQSLKEQEVHSRRMENANKRLDQAIFELAILHETGKTINSTLEINKIVSIILEMARQSVSADRARIILYKGESKDVLMDISYSVDDTQASRYLTLDSYAIEWVMQRQEGLLLEDIGRMRLNEPDFWTCSGLGSLMVVPIKRKNQTIGIMLITNLPGKKKFTEKDFQFISTLVNQASIAIENAQLYEELQDHFADTIRALVAAMETKDSYTFGHSDRVTRYSMMIAKQLNFSLTEMRQLEYISLLHDIGKIGIEEEILKKPDSLTRKEWNIVKNHSVLGGSIVKPIKFLLAGEEIIRHHHEWFDGTGYPDGLEGENIPIYSRIISVADAFDAMTSERPYRKSVNDAMALAELRRCAGEQFDPKMVELFIKAYQQ
ncbi:response regulator [bacterium]|nr:response regulator [bacterium]